MTRARRLGLLALPALPALLVLLALLGALSVTGCDRAPAPETSSAPPPAPLVLTLAPAGAGAPALGPDPADDLPLGSRVVRWDPATPGAPLAELSPGLAAAGGACVSHDGARVLFTARERADQRWAVWTCALDGSGLRVALSGPTDVLGGAWLPDGRVVAMMALEQPSGAPGLARGYALVVGSVDGPERRSILSYAKGRDYGPAPAASASAGPAAAAGDAAGLRRITFGAGADLDPAVLPDGRIVYVAWRPPLEGARERGSFALWAVHSDGAGADLYHDPGAEAALVRRPQSAADGRVTYLAGADAASLAAFAASARTPLAAAERCLPGVRPPHNSDAAPVLPYATLLQGARVLHAVTAAAGRRPQGHLSVVDLQKPGGQLLIVDARPAGAPAGSTGPQRLRVSLWTPATGSQAPRAGRALGEVPLAEDGSVFARVPSDVPLLLEVLDAQGGLLERTRTPIWVRPNESRGCVGCHEDRDLAPPNRRPQAVLLPPVDLTAPPPAEALR